MAHLQAGIRSRADLAIDPAQMISAVNDVFWRSSPTEQFATVFYGVYSAASGTLSLRQCRSFRARLTASERAVWNS